MFSNALKQGSVEMLVLSLLEGRALHGYEIGKQIESRSGARLRFRVSSLYPVLCRMEGREWIEGRWVEKAGQRRRRYYRLTEKGRQALVASRKTWEEFKLAIGLVLEPQDA